MSSGPRRQAREAALQVLYSLDSAHRLTPELAEQALARIRDAFTLPLRARERTMQLTTGVTRNLKQIDERVATASTHWKLHRLARVDRNVIRIATYELLFEPETPHEVIIDEAVAIARRFGGEESQAFVNGVLDLIARDRAGHVE
ncbi:MAG: transcription antitermination factor NusB [Myxococcales bacterium]|nr:transcription antitermination factor NusB [Myxococcales bacterium]